MTQWHDLYITDKSNKKHFRTTCTDWGLNSELKNLRMHIENAKNHPEHYSFLDAESARIVSPVENEFDFCDDDIELLESLGV